jgi:hypothetical protein
MAIKTDAPLKEVVIISLGTISLWSGRARLVADDLNGDPEDLPPAAIASLGSKRLFPREKLMPLEKVKRAMWRALITRGTRFLNGVAIAHADVTETVAELNKLVAEGNRLRDDLLKHFEDTVQKWHAENPDWKHILAAGTPEKEYVRNRINFGWDAFMAAEPSNEALADKLRLSVGQMGNNLFREIEKEAQEFVTKSLKPSRNTATQRTVTPLRRMVQKLGRLGMLDNLAVPVANVCNAVLSTLPSQGRVTDGDYLKLIRLANLLADVREMRGIGQRVLDGLPVSDAANELMGCNVMSGSLAAEAPSVGVDQSSTSAIFDGDGDPPIQVVPTPALGAPVVGSFDRVRTDTPAPARVFSPPPATKPVVLDF